VPTYLWKDRGVVPLLKVDKGLADEQDGVQVSSTPLAYSTPRANISSFQTTRPNICADWLSSSEKCRKGRD
jgi:fructose-bisphosphate aldolase class 1